MTALAVAWNARGCTLSGRVTDTHPSRRRLLGVHLQLVVQSRVGHLQVHLHAVHQPAQAVSTERRTRARDKLRYTIHHEHKIQARAHPQEQAQQNTKKEAQAQTQRSTGTSTITRKHARVRLSTSKHNQAQTRAP